MSGIYAGSDNSQAAQNIGALTSPDPGSVNGQLVILRGLVDSVEGTLGDATATPPSNSISDRLLSLVSSLAIAASPTASSVQARIQGVLDAIGSIASPAAGTLLNLVTSLQTRLGSTGDAQATNDTGSFSAIALLKLIAARIKAQTDNQLSATATTTLQSIASSTTAVSWGTAAGKGFRIVASSTNATKVLIRLGAAPTATAFTYELSAGQALFEDVNYSGSIQAILPTGNTSCSANVTIFS